MCTLWGVPAISVTKSHTIDVRPFVLSADSFRTLFLRCKHDSLKVYWTAFTSLFRCRLGVSGETQYFFAIRWCVGVHARGNKHDFLVIFELSHTIHHHNMVTPYELTNSEEGAGHVSDSQCLCCRVLAYVHSL